MKIAGSYVVDAPRDEVWSALNDIEVLARTIPGCQRLDQVGEHTFETTLKIGLQAVKGVYSGTVSLSDIQPPHHYKISVDGKGSNGFLRGEGGLELTEETPGKTTITYGGNASIGGTLATVGQRLIEGASRTLINQALKAFSAQIQSRMSGGEAAASAVAVPSTEAEPAADVSTAEALPAATTSSQETTPTLAPEPPSAPAAVPTVSAVKGPVPAAERSGIYTSLNGVNPTAASAAAFPAAPSRKTVVVPHHEQLKPETLILGIAQDFINERPWIPWVIIAFLVGWLLGRKN